MSLTTQTRNRLAVVVLVGLLTGLPSAAQEEYSQARIVRISFAEGAVQIQRPGEANPVEAVVNMPLIQACKLSTGAGGFTEIEFENTSTARLGEQSLLELTQLALKASGGKVNRLTLYAGYASFAFRPEQDDFWEVTAGDAKLTPDGKTLFRVDYDQGQVRVAVFKGAVEVSSPLGTERLTKNEVLSVRPGEDEPFKVAKGIVKDAWDEWVEQRESELASGYKRHSPKLYTNEVGALHYGWYDLGLWGSWHYFPSYGYGWMPRVSTGWIPYANGRWSYFPRFGFTWISYEPWGWLPYHYGQWIYEPVFGWVWLPSAMDMWYPALVNWYEGPGWIGWTPRVKTIAGRALGSCPRQEACLIAVNRDAFQQGMPVSPTTRRPVVDLAQARPVERPDVPIILPGQPTGAGQQTGLLPQSGVERLKPIHGRQPAAGTDPVVVARPGGSPTGPATPSTTPVTATRPAANALGKPQPPADTGISYDPSDGRYVNAPRPSPAPGMTPGGPPVVGPPEASPAVERPMPAPSPTPAVQTPSPTPTPVVIGAPRSGPRGDRTTETSTRPARDVFRSDSDSVVRPRPSAAPTQSSHPNSETPRTGARETVRSVERAQPSSPPSSVSTPRSQPNYGGGGGISRPTSSPSPSPSPTTHGGGGALGGSRGPSAPISSPRK